MKKLLLVTMVLASFVSYGQKSTTLKTPSTISVSLLDGLDFKNKITFKVIEPNKFDNFYGKKSINQINDCLQIANVFLNFEMKNVNSYKPIASPINKIMLLDSDGKTLVHITLVAESQNGYGNKVIKEYHLYSDDATNFKLSSY